MKTVTSNGATIGGVGHGIMFATWTTTPAPDEQVFEAIIAGINKCGPDSKLLLNSGEFYGFNPRIANLQLVSRFFEKYPQYADRVFLSVKGGARMEDLASDSSEANLRRSVDAILTALRGKKKLDLFECARVDPKVPIEDAIKRLVVLKAEGKFDHIGLSEVAANTLRRAHAVHPITIVEIEISPWSYEPETKKVIAAAQELGVAVAGYSPLGSGFLTGKIKKKDLEAGDLRNRSERFNDANEKVVDAIKALADKKSITAAQLCIAWVSSLGSHVIPLPGSSHVTRTTENLAGGDVTFTEEELTEVNKVIAELAVEGQRALPGVPVWG